ncbi:DUF4376 domain-containing protein [Pseudomonas denitrificans (nom. rej.)]|uniref:DUF4376 domain-containing protein n=1 Tax=Pseudomonas denitrificans TaxID=43306 RepID=A0A9X7N304_PSEDE|nr:DUF4376 domain-containing protein [Pseudomonas denitrificans (nom. rej.)]QEY74101.1 DUF4376 domain-containing protein [Pseudomonas denitrificans (nom. rej.)]
MFYSASAGGFYSQGIHGDAIPDDAIAISEELHARLLEGQQNGQRIAAGEDGMPMLVDRPGPDMKSIIADRRYLAETAGIVVNGMPLDTGRDSQALVTGAALAAVIDSAYSCQWKTAGGFIDLDAQQIIAIASAMRAHVQACFDREAELLDAVAAGTYSAEQLDQGWPA